MFTMVFQNWFPHENLSPDGEGFRRLGKNKKDCLLIGQRKICNYNGIYHINLHVEVFKIPKYYSSSSKINIKSTSMYNKLWKKQEDFCINSSN
jgi:hypothetical protein